MQRKLDGLDLDRLAELYGRLSLGARAELMPELRALAMELLELLRCVERAKAEAEAAGSAPPALLRTRASQVRKIPQL